MLRFLCRIGVHRWMDLDRRPERLGQDATEQCLRCGKVRGVLRLFWEKRGPMHPRASA